MQVVEQIAEPVSLQGLLGLCSCSGLPCSESGTSDRGEHLERLALDADEKRVSDIIFLATVALLMRLFDVPSCIIFSSCAKMKQ